MSDVVYRLARLGEDDAIRDFINSHFDMRLPLINRPDFYRHYYVGRGGVPQFAVAEENGRYLSAAGYILANTEPEPDIQQATRRYAKRQMTWFRANPAVQWLDASAGADEIFRAALQKAADFDSGI